MFRIIAFGIAIIVGVIAAGVFVLNENQAIEHEPPAPQPRQRRRFNNTGNNEQPISSNSFARRRKGNGQYKYKKQNNSDNVDFCGICLESNLVIFRPINCNHFFHKECILKWFTQKKDCPICRVPSNGIVEIELRPGF
ncbi:hypothetical protein ABEB36_001096 [Hypothenemus hampei]|uniref:RING-type E3 ubiquitin transferase n=1 Tax=Hypothenemus hampei TaxID=57062 RepID=A0ABD1FDH1_HYPHA